MASDYTCAEARGYHVRTVPMWTVLTDMFEKYMPTFESLRIGHHSVQFSEHTADEWYGDLYPILERATELLKADGMSTSSTDDNHFEGLVEFHEMYTSEDGTVSSTLIKHEDDYGGVHFAVNTVIWYLEKIGYIGWWRSSDFRI